MWCVLFPTIDWPLLQLFCTVCDDCVANDLLMTLLLGERYSGQTNLGVTIATLIIKQHGAWHYYYCELLFRRPANLRYYYYIGPIPLWRWKWHVVVMWWMSSMRHALCLWTSRLPPSIPQILDSNLPPPGVGGQYNVLNSQYWRILMTIPSDAPLFQTFYQ